MNFCFYSIWLELLTDYSNKQTNKHMEICLKQSQAFYFRQM